MAKLTEVYSEKQFKKFQPAMICNIEKQQEGNKKIYSRSFPVHGHNTNTLGFRSSFNVCKKYKKYDTRRRNRKFSSIKIYQFY